MLFILRKLLIPFIVMLMLVGCSAKDSDSRDVSTPTDTIMQPNELLEKVQDVENSPVIFDSDLEMPLLKDGTVYGTLSINFVEKLGIWDINNYQANQNGVHFSYAINCNVNLDNYFTENEMINVVIEPHLYDFSENEIGNSGYVGWSGYNTSVDLYTKSTSGNCEVVLQPTENDFDKYQYFTLQVSDATNAVMFDTLYVDLKCLRDAPQGAQLKTIEDKTTITSINGGQFNISFENAYLELHTIKKDPIYRPGDYRFYDFCYNVEYVTAPQNDVEVLTFDSFNNYAMVDAPIMEVYSDQDNTKLLEPVTTAQRLMWSNRNKTELYVTTFPKALYAGENVTVSTNRMVPDSTVLQPTYIRVVLKFPSEIKARSYEQIRDFNGRYVVYQLLLNNRVLEEEPK